ncbi:hypothetical protein BHE74_00013328 [Ensete ventricosum]|nr:hypothetical protein BHE74_00013328 [Ensete ventricosum]
MEETLLATESGGGRDGKGWVSRFVWGDGGRELMDEAQRLGYVAAPMVAVTMSQFLVQVVSSMMVGHLGKLDLASAAIATSLTSVTGFSLLVCPPSLLSPSLSRLLCFTFWDNCTSNTDQSGGPIDSPK